MRELIVSEIRRLAAENGGKAPGRGTFTKVTGITPAKWTGVYWARWGDALAEAGLTANSLQERYDTHDVLRRIADLCRKLGRVPTRAEIKMQRSLDSDFPSHSTVANHFKTNAEMVNALRELCNEPSYADLLHLLPEQGELVARGGPVATKDGWVYLLKSGDHYKIGRSDQIETRLKTITVALPEAATLMHAIRTDDPPGIEGYWHRRFADRRANGEWFRLSSIDVRAFSRRTFQ